MRFRHIHPANLCNCRLKFAKLSDGKTLPNRLGLIYIKKIHLKCKQQFGVRLAFTAGI